MVKFKPLKFKIFYNKRVIKFLMFVVLSLVSLLAISIFLKPVVEIENQGVPYLNQDLTIDYSLGILWAMILGVSILFWPISSGARE